MSDQNHGLTTTGYPIYQLFEKLGEALKSSSNCRRAMNLLGDEKFSHLCREVKNLCQALDLPLTTLPYKR